MTHGMQRLTGLKSARQAAVQPQQQPQQQQQDR